MRRLAQKNWHGFLLAGHTICNFDTQAIHLQVSNINMLWQKLWSYEQCQKQQTIQRESMDRRAEPAPFCCCLGRLGSTCFAGGQCWRLCRQHCGTRAWHLVQASQQTPSAAASMSPSLEKSPHCCLCSTGGSRNCQVLGQHVHEQLFCMNACLLASDAAA